jgi:hypothetical protein
MGAMSRIPESPGDVKRHAEGMEMRWERQSPALGCSWMTYGRLPAGGSAGSVRGAGAPSEGRVGFDSEVAKGLQLSLVFG